MSEEEELIIVKRVEETLIRLKIVSSNSKSLCLNSDEYNICIKHGIDKSQIICLGHSQNAHSYSKPVFIGTYTPRKGFYKIVRLEKNVKIPYYPNIIINAIYAKFKDNYSDDFIGTEVLINSKPLYNYNSIGPKNIKLEVGQIIEIKSTSLESGDHNKYYKIDWNVIHG